MGAYNGVGFAANGRELYLTWGEDDSAWRPYMNTIGTRVVVTEIVAGNDPVGKLVSGELPLRDRFGAVMSRLGARAFGLIEGPYGFPVRCHAELVDGKFVPSQTPTGFTAQECEIWGHDGPNRHPDALRAAAIVVAAEMLNVPIDSFTSITAPAPTA